MIFRFHWTIYLLFIALPPGTWCKMVFFGGVSPSTRPYISFLTPPGGGSILLDDKIDKKRLLSPTSALPSGHIPYSSSDPPNLALSFAKTSGPCLFIFSYSLNNSHSGDGVFLFFKFIISISLR